MGESPQNSMLMEALEQNEQFKRSCFTAACCPRGSVVVDYCNHVRGVWDFYNGHYFWTSAGYAQPSFRTHALDEAVSYTLKSVAAVPKN